MPRKTKLNPTILKAADTLDIEAFRKAIREHFSDFRDPRQEGKITYPAWYLILVILTGFLSGCDTVSDLAQFAELRQGWLADLAGEVEQPPSYDTIWWFLGRTEPEAFKKLIRRWLDSLSLDLKEQVLALDGKRLRGASYLGEAVHLVELFATEDRLVIAQESVPNKRDERSTLEPILATANVEGAIISMDALYTNQNIASLVIEHKADYIMAVKRNQPDFFDELENFFDQAHDAGLKEASVSSAVTIDRGHGRIEKREVFMTSDLDWLPQHKSWPGLQSIIEVVRERTQAGTTSRSRNFYISSQRASASVFATWIRSHWRIENNLHWVADVVFREDASLASMGYTAENMGIMRRLVTNMIAVLDPTTGLAKARRSATYEPRYLTGLLAGLFVN